MRKICELGRYVLSKCGADKKEFLSAVYKRRTQAKKHQLDVPQFGRSMVEMLGVLAIIGVLSVGAIAGYSKAMFKYKLNKHSEQINQLIDAVSRFYQQFINEQFYDTVVTSYFIKMGEVPDEMITNNDEDYVYDIFGTKVGIRNTHDESSGATSMNLTFYQDLSKHNKQNEDICINILNTVKQNRASIYYATVVGVQNGAYSYVSYHGDHSCTSSKKCLKNMNIKDMHDMCISQISKESATISVVWYDF